jgi:hypothetical protein
VFVVAIVLQQKKERKMQAVQCVVFAPQSKQEVKALLQYLETNRPAINARKSAEYKAEVLVVREKMAAHFAVNPPQKRVRVCPWDTTGAKSQCANIANKYSVPIWDVIEAANPGATLKF